MPIYKGLNKIGNINKGTTTISNIYKGAVLVYSSAKWLSYGFTKLYYSLIPTTIDSKSVKNKLKITKVYGDSVVENQLVENGDFSSNSNWTCDGSTFTVSNNKAVITVGSNGVIAFYQSIAKKSGHKYIVKATIKSSTSQELKINWGANLQTVSLTTSEQVVAIYLGTTPSGNDNLNFTNTGLTASSTIEIRNVQIFDLTQMFPFDTPTSLIDTRVQALLNRGYIEYNTGEIKSVDISEFSSARIPGIYQEVEYIESTGTQYIDMGLVINAPTKAEYSFMITNSVSYGHAIAGVYNEGIADLYFGIVRSADEKLNYRYRETFYPSISTIVQNTKYNIIVELDVGSQSLSLNGNIETTSNNTQSFTNSLSCYLFSINNASVSKMRGRLYYFKIYNNNTLVRNLIPCYRKSDNEIGLYDTVNRVFYTNAGTGTFLKGNNIHTNEHTLSFKSQLSGANTSKDTFEITSNGYVFTKNIGRYTFNGSESFIDYYGGGYSQTLVISDIKTVSASNIANAIWNLGITIKGELIASGLPEYTIAVISSRLYIMTTKTSSQLASALTGETIYYQLATLQTITIPKKHLAWVDLGSLNWTYDSSNARFYAPIDNLKAVALNGEPNIYCILYRPIQYQYNTYSENATGTMFVNASGTINIYIRNTSYTDTTTFKNAMNGIYLFYETDSEVADIDTQIDIESGGTLTSDSDVLPNVDTLVKCK